MQKKIEFGKFFAVLYLFVFTTQIVFIEGYEVSNIKVFLMVIAPILLLLFVPYLTKALFWGGLYSVSVLLVSLSHDYVRLSTISYLILFVFTIIFYYNLIYSKILRLEDFIKIVRCIILLYFVCLLLQQVSIIIGFRNFFIINLYNQHFLSIDKLPSLSIEPSHSARILTAYMFSYLKCNEFLYGRALSFRELFIKKHRWVCIGFLWTMLTMGSGTAFIGLGLLSLYFIKRTTFFYVLPIIIFLFLIASNMKIKQLDRSLNVVEATMSGDIEKIRETDGSAAVRIVPIINTFKNLNFFSKDTWVGVGTTSKEYNKTGWLRDNVKLGAVEQYGFLTYILSLIFIFKCFIRKILSIESLIFIVFLGASFSNVYYVWGIMMLFICIRYFEKSKDLMYE